jgi:ribosome maturation factor RimP
MGCGCAEQWAGLAHFFIAVRFRLPSVAGPIVTERELDKLIVPELETLGFECVKLEVVGSPRHPVVRLFIDKPGGVTVGECARVSRAIGLVLDREDPFPGHFLLEVSSPGSNRPLVTEAHFQRFVGSDAKVVVERADTGRSTHVGRIRSCAGEALTLDTDEGEVVVQLRDVVKANLINQEYKIDKKREKDRRPANWTEREGEE